MCFHEKTAWAALAGLLVSTLWYVWRVAGMDPAAGFWATQPSLWILAEIVAVMVGVLLIGVVLLSALGQRAPATGLDEREARFEADGERIGYYALSIGIMPALWLIATGRGPAAFHAVILAMSLAGLAQYASHALRHRLSA